MDYRDIRILKMASRVLLDQIEVLHRLEKNIPDMKFLEVAEKDLEMFITGTAQIIWDSK